MTVDAAMDALLASQAAHWSWGLRKTWALLYRQRLTKPQAYAELIKHDFTSAQVGSMLISAEMRHAGLVELKKYELKQLELAVDRRERAVFDKSKKVLALTKRQTKLQAKCDKFAPQPGKERTKRYLTALRVLRDIVDELTFCRNWIAQKERVLRDKHGKLKSLEADIAAGHYSLCFGSKKLLAQRPTEHNEATTPFESREAWQSAWTTARDGQWWSVGHTKQESGNKEVRWLPASNQLCIRLTDRLAHERMDEQGVPRSGTQQKFMPLRMQCRFVTIDDVDFTSHRGAARAALLDAFGKRPVTMRVLSRLQPDGSRAWYVQASLEVPSGFETSRPVTRESGVIGLDFNARGVAWCAVKPDGNRLRDQYGFMPWQLKGLAESERKQVIGTTVAQLARHAKRLSMAVAIESLDFSTKRLTARAGAVNKRYNDMLGSLPSSQFEQMMLRASEKQHLTLYSVNPVYSSVGGFAKYGCANRMNADTSAALWIGRQALLADVRKDEGPQVYMKHFDERLVFPHLPATPMQRMTALAGASWRDVAWGLGSNRRLWGVKLRRWFELQVETASRTGSKVPEQPAAALSPAG